MRKIFTNKLMNLHKAEQFWSKAAPLHYSSFSGMAVVMLCTYCLYHILATLGWSASEIGMDVLSQSYPF